MSETTTYTAPRHYGHEVWEDEEGGTYYLAGHVPTRRAIAAVNRYARVECGLINLADDHDTPLSFVTVRHVWWKPVPNEYPDWEEGHMTPAAADEDGVEPFTEVSW